MTTKKHNELRLKSTLPILVDLHMGLKGFSPGRQIGTGAKFLEKNLVKKMCKLNVLHFVTKWRLQDDCIYAGGDSEQR